MTTQRARIVGLTALCSIAALSVVSTQQLAFADATEEGPFYSSKQPYIAPSESDIAGYSQPPAGFDIEHTQLVARHGSRGLSSYKYDALLMLMAQTAQKENGFVSPEVGEAFMKNLESITAANVANGYGMLTGQGATQHRGIGERTYKRNSALFERAIAEGDAIRFESSGEARATESGESFLTGFEAASHNSVTPIVEPLEAHPETLYFHKLENPDGSMKQEGTPAYEVASRYEAFIGEQTSDGGVIAGAMDYIESLPQSQESARRVLSQIFTPEFIDSIGDDAHTWFNTADGSKDGDKNCAPNADESTDADACGSAKKKITSAVDAAMDLYNLYIIDADMQEENTGEHAFDFEQYFANYQDDAKWFSYLLDAEDFYEKGPGVTGTDGSYAPAQPLLDDFFAQIDERTAGGSHVATFRFAHAETIAPFSALLRLPGSTQQAPAVSQPVSIDDVFNYATNEWRGSTVMPMAANVQWDTACQAGTDPATGRSWTPIVRMLVNEVETPFNSSCTAVAEGSSWYKVSELRHCLLGQAQTESPLLTKSSPVGPSGKPEVDPAQTTGDEEGRGRGVVLERPSRLAATGSDSGLVIAGLAAILMGTVLVTRRR